jgi:hypothetical protein
MPVHIGEVSSEVDVAPGGAPFSEAQLEFLVKAVMKRLEDAKRAEQASRAATRLKPDSAPRSSAAG